MSRKKKTPKNLFENMSVEPDDVHRPDAHAEPPAETNAALPESTDGESESPADELNQVEAQEEVASLDGRVAESSAEEAEETSEHESAAEPSSEETVDTSADDLLEDVRRSLIEEEQTHEKEEQPKWWKRIGKGSRKTTPEPEAARAIEEISLPDLESEDTVSAAKQETESEEYLDDIDELIDLLETEETQNKGLKVVEETPPEPEKVVDVEELKKQAFQPRQNAATEQSVSEVRSIALEGDEEVFVEVQSTSHDPLEERISAVENALTPYRRYINFLVAFIGLIMALVAGTVLFNIYRQSVAASAPTEAPSNIPFPASVALPGGWTFKLAKGSLVDGNWNPKGAEWLTGTEVCRWVALPWSKQLEAVIRTLNPDDPIQLGMSNNDTLTYKVYSIQQMSPAEMQALDSNRPCLLVVLAEPAAEKRWVLTSLP